jgi:hypothetical protein
MSDLPNNQRRAKLEPEPQRLTPHFTKSMQGQILAGLLQEPSLYSRFFGVWKAEYFRGVSCHLEIVNSFIILRETIGEHPTCNMLKDHLLRTYRGERGLTEEEMSELLDVAEHLANQRRVQCQMDTGKCN